MKHGSTRQTLLPSVSQASTSRVLPLLPIFCLAVLLVLSGGGARAGDVPTGAWVVGGGSTVRLGDGVLRLGCNDVQILNAGTLAGERGTVQLAGSWLGEGTFVAGTGNVRFTDGCSPGAPEVAALTGNNTFYLLEVITAMGKVINLEAGSVQSVQNRLILSGASGNLLRVRSAVPGQEAFFNLTGTQSVDFVDVQDNHATGQPLAPGPAAQFNSVDSGNTVGWFVPPLFADSFESGDTLSWSTVVGLQ